MSGPQSKNTVAENLKYVGEFVVGHRLNLKITKRSRRYVKLVINFSDHRTARSPVGVRGSRRNRRRNRQNLVRDFSGSVFGFPRIWEESRLNTKPLFPQIKALSGPCLPSGTQLLTHVEQRSQQQDKDSRMKLKLTYQIAAFAVSVVLAGCAKNDQTATEQTTPPTETTVAASEVKKEVSEAEDAIKGSIDKTKDQFIASVDAKLKALDARIDELGEKTQGLKDGTKVEADKVLEALREKRNELTPKLDELKKSSAQSWQDIKNGFSAAMTDLEKALEEAKDKIRKNS
jgi:uncharacterized protein YukE